MIDVWDEKYRCKHCAESLALCASNGEEGSFCCPDCRFSRHPHNRSEHVWEQDYAPFVVVTFAVLMLVAAGVILVFRWAA